MWVFISFVFKCFTERFIYFGFYDGKVFDVWEVDYFIFSIVVYSYIVNI